MIRRRRSLPGGRAVVGALLIAVAFVGVAGAYLTATATPRTAYAVAAADLDPGDVISASDVTFVPLDLPDAVRARSLVDADALVGATVVHARRPGELVQVSDVMRSGAAQGTREISFSIDSSRALGERILPGERIDVLATYGAGDQAYALVVVADALVLRTSAAQSSLVGEGRLELTLALDEPVGALALAHAVDVGQITVVRATNAAGVELPRSYRPDPGSHRAPAARSAPAQLPDDQRPPLDIGAAPPSVADTDGTPDVPAEAGAGAGAEEPADG